MANRKDKYLHLGFGWIHYIHYYPNRAAIKHWGIFASNFKSFSVDVYIGKHVFVFTFHKKSES